jgi:hypothetical protein
MRGTRRRPEWMDDVIVPVYCATLVESASREVSRLREWRPVPRRVIVGRSGSIVTMLPLRSWRHGTGRAGSTVISRGDVPILARWT